MSRNEQHLALAAVFERQITLIGKYSDPMAASFVLAAREGRYFRSPPIGPDYIGLSKDELRSICALIYGGVSW